MPSSLTTPPAPRALAAIAADQRLGARGHCDPNVGQALRCLAASRIRGVIVHIGSGSVALAAWLIDGMDITSRFVMVVDDEADVAPANAHLGDDIRIAVHAQPALEFLRDVSRNRVDVVVLDDAVLDEPLLDAAMALLSPGGMLCLLSSDGAAPAWLDSAQTLLARRHDCQHCRLHTPAPLLLAVRLPPDARPVRRGGRAARQASGRKPVINLR